MIGLITIAAIFIFVVYTFYYTSVLPAERNRLKLSEKRALPLILAFLTAALAARVISSLFYLGYKPDVQCFSSWADMVYKHGFSKFYKLDAFTDYPPGYMYILYIIGFIKRVFSLGSLDTATVLILKMPAILCDLATGYLIFALARKHASLITALTTAALYLFNPAVFTDSALWGQVDSVLTLCLLGVILCAYYGKLIPAYFLFALAILIKPQALIMTPILIWAVIEQVFLNNFSWNKFWKNLGFGLCAICALALSMTPFGLSSVISQYTETLASYPYATVNTFNLWGAFNLNWEPLTPAMSAAGNIFIAFIVAATAIIFFRSQDKSKYFFVAGFLFFATLTLSTKMHERYAFPCIVMILCAFVTTKNIHNLSLFALCSATQFINMGYVLFLYAKDIQKYYRTTGFIAMSVVVICTFAYMLFCAYTMYVRNKTIKNLKKG